MKILLDGKDLINLAEHSTPIQLEELDHILRLKKAKLVLSFMNVRELAAPIAITGEILRIRALLNRVESLPVCYIREGFIISDELRAAVTGFETGKEYTPIDPFVRRWDYTFHPGESPARDYVNYSLFDIVRTISRENAQLLLHPKRLAQILREQFATERQMPLGVKKSVVANFPDALARHLSHWGLTAPTKGVRAFAKWIYANPARCPGYRLSYEMFHAIQANLTDVPKDGDIPDLAYLLALPYVHYLTLDRRMYDYALRVSGKFSKANSAVDYKPRLFRSLKELLAII